MKIKSSIDEIRFGKGKEDKPANGPVIEYKLSPEELAKYQKGADQKMTGQGNLKEAKRLITETQLSVDEIAKRTGANKGTIKAYVRQMRIPEVKVMDQATASFEEELKVINKEREELKSELNRVKSELDNKTHEVIDRENEIKELQRFIETPVSEFHIEGASLEEENKLLRDSNDYLYQENLELRIRVRTFKSAMRELIADQGV